MRKVIRWLDDYLEEVLLVAALAAMAVIMGVQVFCRYVLGASLSWSEELTRYIFIWAGFLSISFGSGDGGGSGKHDDPDSDSRWDMKKSLRLRWSQWREDLESSFRRVSRLSCTAPHRALR